MQLDGNAMPLTRRTLLKSAATLAAVPAFADEPAATREPLRQFPYAAVQLTSGPFHDQYQAIKAHYLALSNDSLLKVYRQRAGLPTPDPDMGGWYDTDGFVPGHGLGQYISGLCRLGASTSDPACNQKAAALVEGFAATLGPKNESILRPATNLWTCYTLDKHFAGLIDAATLANIPGAKDLLNRVLAGARPILPAQGHDRIGKKNPPYDETFVMPENLFLAATLTGNPAFKDLAHRYLLDRELFDPLALGRDPFPGQHAYSHAIALSSAGQAYLAEGDPKYRAAMQHAFQLLSETQQFASGGWGPNETFITPHRGELHAALSSTVDHFETPCGSYAATKLARYLLRTAVPKDTSHADNLERVLYNTILAVRFPGSFGEYPYYSTYSPIAEKVFYQKKWPCCSGTLIQTVADYPLNLYFQHSTGVYVTGYTPSHLAFAHAGTPITLVQNTLYPSADTTTITLHPARPTALTLYVRIPSWLTGTATLKLNREPLSVPAQPGTYAAITRTWVSGDHITLTLPQSFRTEPIDDQHPNVVALMRGPVQYVAVTPPAGLDTTPLALPASLKQLAPQAFAEDYAGKQVLFIPLHHIKTETYTTYFTKA